MYRQVFTPSDIWYGGFYELALELGARSDEKLQAALRRVWSFPSLEGCYLDSEREPSEQPRVEVPSTLEEPGQLRGIALLPNGKRVACATFIVREEDGPDWLGFYVPMGALSITGAYDVGGYPFDVARRSHKEWQHELDGWLADLGAYVFRAVPFRLGLIGHEVSGDAYADEIEKQGIPEDRYIGYLWPQGDEVKYFPMNRQYGEPENGDSTSSPGQSLRGIAQRMSQLIRGKPLH